MTGIFLLLLENNNAENALILVCPMMIRIEVYASRLLGNVLFLFFLFLAFFFFSRYSIRFSVAYLFWAVNLI